MPPRAPSPLRVDFDEACLWDEDVREEQDDQQDRNSDVDSAATITNDEEAAILELQATDPKAARMLRNRLSAAASRKRKKAYTDALESKCVRLEWEIAMLKTEMAAVEARPTCRAASVDQPPLPAVPDQPPLPDLPDQLPLPDHDESLEDLLGDVAAYF